MKFVIFGAVSFGLIFRLTCWRLAAIPSKSTSCCKLTSVSDAGLANANLQGADLRGANLREANLTGTNLSGAALGGASLRGANASWGKFEGS